MITKTHKGDLGLGVPEKKKKKKKKVVKEPETQYSVLNSDNYFTEICPTRAPSPSKSVVLGQASEMPVLKKKKKKKGHSTLCEEHLEPETMLRAGRTEKLSSPRKQALGSSEFQGGEKKKKRKSLRPLAMPSGSRVKTSPDNRQGEEVTRVVKKPKKHKKEKAAQEAAAFSAKDPWFCEAGDTPSTCSVGKDGKEQAASGQKRKQGSPRECNMKVKKKKIHQKGDTSLEGHLECSKSLESSPRKGSKKPVKVEAPEYIPIGHNPKSPAKKKMKSKKKVEPPGIEEPALKRNKKKKGKESRVGEEPWEEDPDTDLEVVLEKKGNMDEAHIDQVRPRPSPPFRVSCHLPGTHFSCWETLSLPTTLTEGPSGHSESQAEAFFLVIAAGGDGSVTPGTVARAGNMCLARPMHCHLQASIQEYLEKLLYCGSASAVPRSVGRCILYWSTTF
uniref:Lysine rich nucleolar protein 1 n=1 Tax=Ursus americanus TaxID=9643 RepID=A0A452Q8I3_URSAM